MSSVLTPATVAAPESALGQPTWEITRLFPWQGQWTETEFVSLDAPCLAELNDGVLEFPEMPDRAHQWLQKILLRLLDDYVMQHRLGEVLGAPTPIRLRPGKLREPDVFYLSNARRPADPRAIPDGADLVVEIVSITPKSRRHDVVTKRSEYAAAGFPEYWIVDPETDTITVLTLPAGATEYAVHGEFRPGQQATSVLLPGFAVDVAACFAAGRGGPK
ncbi:MAG: Uma2 family endonuclease [Planctomycetaceae bacterium]|nr:Uma2 family endonuclease [Planctomycetaceae bacterium]